MASVDASTSTLMADTTTPTFFSFITNQAAAIINSDDIIIINNNSNNATTSNGTNLASYNINDNNWTTSTAPYDPYDYYPDGDPRDKSLHHVAMWIIRVAFPVIVLVGTFGNAMILVVLKRGAIRTDNLSFFLSVLAVVDTVFLYSNCFQAWLRVVADLNLLHLGTWSCKLILFLSQASQCVSAWLVVIITWQRWYTCAQPFQRCCPTESPAWGYLGLAVLLVVLLGANSYVLITVQLYDDEWGPPLCAPSGSLDDTIGDVFPLILMVLASGAPAALLFLLNGLLVHVLYRSRRALLTSHSASRTTGRDEVRARYNHVTVMLVALSGCWFVFAMPQTILKQFEPYPDTAHEAATNRFLNVVAYAFLFLNHSINFFIYCTLMRSFRREVKRTIKQMVTCVTSTVHGGAYCSSTRQESVTDLHLRGHVHNHNRNHCPHHHQQHHHHHHHHHHHPQNQNHHQHHQHQNNSQADSYRPLIIKFNVKPGQAGGYSPQAHSY